MGDAIGQLLPFAVGVGLSPIPIVAVVVMLSTPRGHVNGPAFLVGWIIGLAAVGTAVIAIAGGAGASDGGEPSSGAGVAELALGALLLVLAVKQWRGRPRGDEEPELPGWMARVDAFSPVKAAGMGVLLSAANPKNLVLTAGAAAAIAETGIAAGDEAVALAVFVVIGTIGVIAPIVISLTMGARANALLEELHSWLARENATIMAVLCLVIGAKLLGSGIAAL